MPEATKALITSASVALSTTLGSMFFCAKALSTATPPAKDASSVIMGQAAKSA